MAVWSVVQFKDIDLRDRFDAEYFQPAFLDIATALEGKGKALHKLGNLTCSAFYPAAAHLYERGTVPFIRCVDVISHPVINADQPFERIPAEFILENKSVRTVSPGDVIITKVGTPCYASVIDDSVDYAALTRTVLGVVNINQTEVDPYYLVAFLRSDYGFYQLMREREQQIQLQLTLERVGRIRVFLPDLKTQQHIGNIVRQYYNVLKKANSLYTQAKTLLLHELGINTIDLSHQTTYTATFAEMMDARRMDAEYFQPKYTNLIEQIQTTGQSVCLGDWISEPIRRGVLPNYVEDGDITVINSQHIGKTHIELHDTRTTNQAFTHVPKNRRSVVKKYDVLLNSTGYITIGRAQTLLNDVQAVVDGHISIIRPKQGLDPVYLGLYLNSLPGQLQTEQNWTGSSGQIELRPEVISDYIIWKAPETIQQQVRQFLEASHQSRKQATKLLEQAKLRVEKLIQAQK